MRFRKEELINATGAIVLKDNLKNDEDFEISTDTRTIKNGDIYLPLKGASFDGENFIDNALKNGASAYFTAGSRVLPNSGLVLKVSDTKEAYLDIAKYYRQKVNPITIAVTGSAGKTSTKEILYSVISQKYKTQKTFSNHNNEIGFCQTILGMEPDSKALIVEMGMRGLGEIELLTTHLNPDYAIITNCGSAHVGRLGSLDNIAVAKCEIVKGLKSNGIIFAKDQNITRKHIKFDGEKVFYSLNDVEIKEKKVSYSRFLYKGYEYELNVEGEYNIENSLGVIEICLRLGFTPLGIANGLTKYHPIEKRWEVNKIGGLKFINDSYNANPESVKAAVKAFVELYENPVVILGNMCELGENEIEYHHKVGEYLAELNKNVKYIFIGELAKEIGKVLENKGFEVEYFSSNYDAGCYIVENLNKNNTIFLKASGSMKLSEILENIKRGICKL